MTPNEIEVPIAAALLILDRADERGEAYNFVRVQGCDKADPLELQLSSLDWVGPIVLLRLYANGSWSAALR